MRILLIANFETSFVMDDLAILSELGETRFWNTNAQGGLFQPGGAKLMELIASSDVVYGWFASVYLLGPAIMCRLIGVPLVVVSGGYDAAHVPEIGYGNAGHAIKKLVSRSILKRASAIIVNSRFSVSDMLRFMPEAVDRLYCLNHRIHPQLPDNEEEAPARNPKLLVSVALLNRMNYRRKKMEFIKEIARAMPDYEVVHIGLVDPGMEKAFHHDMPGNMRALGYVSDEELWQWYQRAHGLLIPSWHEGFGITAAEAPAAGCIPFISGAGAQSEVTLGFGVELPEDDVMRWKKAIEATQQFPEAKRKEMQQAMIDTYTGPQRKEGIRNILKSHCASQPARL
jgi:glycosyltransferase involved in cell wall biosynthesis